MEEQWKVGDKVTIIANGVRYDCDVVNFSLHERFDENAVHYKLEYDGGLRAGGGQFILIVPREP